MCKQAVINKDLEGRDQGATLGHAKALIVSLNSWEKIIEPRRVPDRADQKGRRKRHPLCANRRKKTTIQSGTSYDRFLIPHSFQELSEPNSRLDLLL